MSSNRTNSITLKQLRKLNEHEIEVLEAALSLLAQSKFPKARYAEIMLEQKMPENFLWASN